MYEIGPQHPLTYRQELLGPLFQKLKSGESAVAIGAASMGKSRLLHFMLRPDVHQHYLAERAPRTLLLWADCNRLVEISPWALYELILTALVEAAGRSAELAPVQDRLFELRRDAIVAENALLAQRNLEFALRTICWDYGFSVGIILDEFDECLETLPAQTLATLRALRDANKYRLAYVAFLRNLSDDIRDPAEYEGFYEIFSRSIFGLAPYQHEDSNRILQQLEARRAHESASLTGTSRQRLLELSGGHPGLLVALFDAFIAAPPVGVDWMEWSTSNPKVREELRKLWRGLRHEERQMLTHAAHAAGTDPRAAQSLLLKGLLCQDAQENLRFFSPLLGAYARESSPLASTPLLVDLTARLVYVDGALVDSLTATEYSLLAYLYERQGEICSHDEILEHLYQDGQYDVELGSASTWVLRLRKKIEPEPKNPIYVINARGKGYRLLVDPQ